MVTVTRELGTWMLQYADMLSDNELACMSGTVGLRTLVKLEKVRKQTGNARKDTMITAARSD